MIIIDGTNMALGRMASYAAKQALKGEDVRVVNCKDIVITGNRKAILAEFKEKKSKVGSGFGGPKHSLVAEKVAKRAIRGMIPNHREGRGREAIKRVKCFKGLPDEFKDKEMIKQEKAGKVKFWKLSEVLK